MTVFRPPKFHEKTPRETPKERNGGGKGKKKSKILGGPAEGGPAEGEGCPGKSKPTTTTTTTTPNPEQVGPEGWGLGLWGSENLAKTLKLTKVGLAKVGQSRSIKVGQSRSNKDGQSRFGQSRSQPVER